MLEIDVKTHMQRGHVRFTAAVRPIKVHMSGLGSEQVLEGGCRAHGDHLMFRMDKVAQHTDRSHIP